MLLRVTELWTRTRDVFEGAGDVPKGLLDVLVDMLDVFEGMLDVLVVVLDVLEGVLEPQEPLGGPIRHAHFLPVTASY